MENNNQYPLEQLEEGLLKALESNPSAELPYHNNDHMKAVWKIARKIWLLEGSVDNTPLDMRGGMEALCIASLLHDYNHTGGREADSVNITRAKMALRLIIRDLAPDIVVPHAVVETALAAIDCTVFPFTIRPRNRIEEILRDADVLYATISGEPEIILKGLRSEINVSRPEAPLSVADMLAQQRAFIPDVELFTVSGKYQWHTFAPQFLHALEEYVEAGSN